MGINIYHFMSINREGYATGAMRYTKGNTNVVCLKNKNVVGNRNVLPARQLNTRLTRPKMSNTRLNLKTI